MGIRKGIIVGAAVFAMMTCTACRSSVGSASEANDNEAAAEENAIVKTTIDKTEEATTEEKEAQAATEEKEEGENTEMADTRDDAMAENYENYGDDESWNEDDFSFDSILGIDQLDLNYEAHVAGFDGESFLYSVYIDGGVSDEKAEEIQQAVADISSQSGDGENYIGYIDIQKGEDKIMIYHDLGGVSEENCNAAVAGLLGALNNVPGIKQVIINEDMAGFDY